MTAIADHRPRSPMERAIEILNRLFAGRRDLYATFVPGEKYSGKKEERELTEDVWRAHIRGDVPIGVYPLLRLGDQWVTQWACIDIDRDREPGAAHEIATAIAHAAEIKTSEPVPLYVETTKSLQAHVWLFFEEPTVAWKARAIARFLIELGGYKEYKTKEGGDEITICPAHDAAPPKASDGSGGVGMCIYTPWFGTHAKMGRQVFFDWKSGAIYPDQLGAMENIQRITPAMVELLVDQHDLKPSNVQRISQKPDDSRFVPKAPAGSIVALTEAEFVNLCAKLKALRAMRENPGGCSYNDWFAGIMHLVPFADGRDRAHQLSQLDASRYDAGVTERQWANAVKLYSRDDAQQEARVSQKIVEFWRQGGRSDITPIAPGWCIWNGCFAKRGEVSQGPEKDPTPITNFTATVVCEEYVDDGTGNRERCVRIRGSLMTGQLLPEIAVPTKDWVQIRTWLHKGWGFRPVIYSDDKFVIQCISLCGQDAPERTQYTHTGWTTGADGKPMFLTPHGPRGGEISAASFEEVARVSAPEKLKSYQIPENPSEEQVKQAFYWIEQFLECGKLEATAPLMAAMFLAPLSSFLNLDFALFFTGHTGTHKSSLVAAAMAVWGHRWSKDTLPLSFNATANAMELLAFLAKDLPLPIDNYVPSAKGSAQDTLKRISHSFADHSGRDRASRDAQLVSAKPFRGMCILTGEDVPYAAGAGATNRYYIVPMQRETLRLIDLEAVQEAGWAGKLAPAMTHYLRYLTTKMGQDAEWITKVIGFQYKLEKEARRMAAGKEHDRLTSQTAWMRTGIELLMRCHPEGGWRDASLSGRIATAFGSAIEQRRTMSTESSLPYRFLSSIVYLVQSGKIHGLEIGRDMSRKMTLRAPINRMASMLLGWKAEETAPFWSLLNANSRLALWIDGGDSEGDVRHAYLCLRGDEITTEIKQNFRVECPIVEGARGIAQALVSDGMMDRGVLTDRCGTRMVLEPGGPLVTVWRLKLTKVLQTLGWIEDESTPPGVE